MYCLGDQFRPRICEFVSPAQELRNLGHSSIIVLHDRSRPSPRCARRKHGKTRMATLVLSSVKPFKIELVSPEFQSVFRFEEGLLLGRTLQILSGPCTQIERIIDLCEKEAAADCAVPRSARLFATLYDSDASARMVSMEVKRSDENRLFVSMEQSHAIHAKEALHDGTYITNDPRSRPLSDLVCLPRLLFVNLSRGQTNDELMG